MERKLFLKTLSVFSTGTLALSGSNIYASEKKVLNNIDLTPLFSINNIIYLQGNFIDSKTFRPINAVKLIAKIKKNRFFPLTQSLESTNGSYSIKTGFNTNKKGNEKISIQIEAEGYKSYKNTFHFSTNGCNIHSEEWNYNPNFKPEYIPKNENIENITYSTFNFHLVKI